MDPIISYSAKLSKLETYKDVNEIYGGTYTINDPIQIDLRIWNNRYGTTTVDDLENFVLNIYFDKYEDGALLNFVTVERNGIEEVPITINGNIATAMFLNEVIIKGTPNNGTEDNIDNYIDLTITFNVTAPTFSLKDNDLKSLLIDIVRQ